MSLQLRLFSIVQSSSQSESAIVCSIDISPATRIQIPPRCYSSLFLGARARATASAERAHSPRGQSRDCGTSQRPFVERKAVVEERWTDADGSTATCLGQYFCKKKRIVKQRKTCCTIGLHLIIANLGWVWAALILYVPMSIKLYRVTPSLGKYEGGFIEKFPRALALLSHQIYSSYWTI